MKRFLLLACLALAACAPRPATSPALVPETVSSLLASASSSGQAFHSLRGLAKVKVETAGRTIGGTQVLLAEKPARLRAETLSPFGQPLLVLASDGHRLSILAPGEGRFYQGPATYQNLERFTGLPLRLTDLVQTLLYQIPLLDASQKSAGVTADGHYRLTLQAFDGRREILFFDQHKRLVEMDYYTGGELSFKVTWSRFTDKTPWFPLETTLALPRRQTVATLLFTELKTNVVIPAERFSLEPPVGATVTDLP